jgi:hypothetical protein
VRWLAILILLMTSCSRTEIVTDSGIQGTVVSGPTCPVEQQGSPCPEQPESALIRVTKAGSQTAAGVGRTDANGKFRLTFAPGRYTVTAQAPGAFAGCQPVDVTVPPKKFVTVKVLCDTGIR